MTREQRMTEVFVEVADSLIDDFDLIDFLRQLSAAVGILPADQHDNLQTMAASDEHTRGPVRGVLQERYRPHQHRPE